jgi:hypothetical protein
MLQEISGKLWSKVSVKQIMDSIQRYFLLLSMKNSFQIMFAIQNSKEISMKISLYLVNPLDNKTGA